MEYKTSITSQEGTGTTGKSCQNRDWDREHSEKNLPGLNGDRDQKTWSPTCLDTGYEKLYPCSTLL